MAPHALPRLFAQPTGGRIPADRKDTSLEAGPLRIHRLFQMGIQIHTRQAVSQRRPSPAPCTRDRPTTTVTQYGGFLHRLQPEIDAGYKARPLVSRGFAFIFREREGRKPLWHPRKLFH